MPVQKATPYLFFNGTAEKALQHYKQALGAKIEGLMRYGEMPDVETSTPEDARRVVHAYVRIGGAELMASDTPAGKTTPAGSKVEVCLDYDDVEEMARHFEALAAGGKVTMGLHDTFWGAKFGALVDAYGIHWMFNCTQKKS
ncbi:VOC family protein [Polyangium aurulentum]|uniref:VOC family protein n=1 Tax=Polyangium aurulentum TaxID=2567896 RepID=UPI00146C6F51|nr:VOC family protein [Polyangium aurulentum]UQA60471.1 VOC family protein [Polyangium aurulentum]